MQNNIKVGSENASKITDVYGGSGVISKIQKIEMVPVFAVMVLPKYEVIDLVKMLAVNKSPYHPVMQLASGSGISLELLVRGDDQPFDIEVFGYNGVGPGTLMNGNLLEGYIDTMSHGTDFVNHCRDIDIDLQIVLNEVLCRGYHDNGSNFLPTTMSDGVLNSLRAINSRIIQLYDNVLWESESYWDISKLMTITEDGCKHIDQLESVGAMADAWINSVYSHNGRNVPFRRSVSTRDNPNYVFDYDGCKTWFDVSESATPEDGISVAELRNIRNEVWFQNFWHLTNAVLESRAAVAAAAKDGNMIGTVFFPEVYADALAELPFLRDHLPHSNHYIKGVCIRHPSGQTEYHQVRRKDAFTDGPLSTITRDNLPKLLLACPGASLATMVAKGMEFGKSTIETFTF